MLEMALDLPFENTYARLPDRFFARLDPEPVRAPSLIALNHELAIDLGLDPLELTAPEGVAVLAGNARAGGSEPLAQAYAGHQFGGWVPQLGDGRAHLLGEIVDRSGIRRDVQLKGSGPTPFSRMGDGRAWLGPVMREYLVSEAMHALGVPTTRALAAVTTGEIVQRERAFPGAVLTRVSASHLRVGTFQYFASRKDRDGLAALLEFAITRHVPNAQKAKYPVREFFQAVVEAQANLVAQWMGLGFVHGVMNTDNTTISGETIDYGPCAFIDGFQHDAVFSSIDSFGRYAYKNQPEILVWNLAQLGGALLPLMEGPEEAAAEELTSVLRGFLPFYERAWLSVFRVKLGLSGTGEDDRDLIQDLLDLMHRDHADFTNTFAALGQEDARDQFVDRDAFDAWAERWTLRRGPDSPTPKNPSVIPRNHRIEEAIQAGLEGNFDPFHRLCRVLKTPYELATADIDLARPPSKDEAVTRTFCGT